MPKVEVKRIQVTIGERTLDLTVEELRELRDVLDELLPRPTVQIATPVPSEPVPKWPEWPKTWCETQAGRTIHGG